VNGQVLVHLKYSTRGRSPWGFISGIAEDDERIALDNLEERKISQTAIPETEKEQLIKARRGQGAFRINLEKIETECRMTRLTDKRFLIASHIKPWCFSSNEERLDGNNGLLMSPHVDKLFDRGWISFSDDGQVLFSNERIAILMKSWGLNPLQNVGEFNQFQRKYLDYHRTRTFKTSEGQP
jgi:predicted restriction endonuclease